MTWKKDFGVPVGAYDLCILWPISPASSVRYRAMNSAGAIRPLDNGPTQSNASLNVAKPTSTSSCL